MTVMEDCKFSSPVRKLVRFFWRSRDKWKSKCQTARAANKLLKNQTRAVERSRDKWKRRCEEQSQRLKELEAELQKTIAAVN
jgi:hypothetical protein